MARKRPPISNRPKKSKLNPHEVPLAICCKVCACVYAHASLLKQFLLLHIKDAVKVEWERQQGQQNQLETVILDLKKRVGGLMSEVSVVNKTNKHLKSHIRTVENWSKTSLVKNILSTLTKKDKKKLLQSFPKYAQNKHGGPPVLAKKHSQAHEMSDDDDDDDEIIVNKNKKRKNKKPEDEHKQLESEEEQLESEDDEIVPAGYFVVKCLHARKLYAPRKGVVSTAGGYQYLTEYEGYPEEKDYSWQFDHELKGAIETVTAFNAEYPISEGAEAVALVPAVAVSSDAVVRATWVNKQLELYCWTNACVEKDVPSAVLTDLWDESFQHSKK